MKLLVAPIHYILDRDEGSEYTRALEFLELVSKKKDISGHALAFYSPFKKMGNIKIISYSKSKPLYISIFLRLRFILWVYLTSRKLMNENKYETIWHLGPFAIGETFSLLALLNRKKTKFVLGPIYTPFGKHNGKDFGLFGKKVFISNSPVTRLKHTLEGTIYNLFAGICFPLSVLTIKMSSEVLTMEDAGKKLLNNLGIKHVKVLSLGIDEDKYLYNRSYKRTKNIKILSIGYFVARKRMIDLIEAMNILVNKKKIKNISLTLVGDGEEREFLTESVKKHNLTSFLDFPGFVPRSKLSEFYKKADIFASGSITESVPGIYFEAMASGLPLVLAENKTSKYMKKNNFGGYVVKGKDPVGFAYSIEKLLKDRKLRKDFGQINTKTVKEKYSLKKNIDVLVSLF